MRIKSLGLDSGSRCLGVQLKAKWEWKSKGRAIATTALGTVALAQYLSRPCLRQLLLFFQNQNVN